MNCEGDFCQNLGICFCMAVDNEDVETILKQEGEEKSKSVETILKQEGQEESKTAQLGNIVYRKLS